MAAMTASMLFASLNGTIVLLALFGAGVYLAYSKILVDATILAFSKAHVNMLLPSLLFTSILDAVYLARTHPSSANVAFVIFPPAWGLITPVCGLIIGYTSVKLCFGKDKSQPVQRAAMMAIAFGNAGNLPLLLLSALCESYRPLSKITPQCIPKSASLTSLFAIPWNILLWQPFFSFLIAAKAPTLGEADIGQFSPLLRKPIPTKDSPMLEKPPLLSPPFIAICTAFVTAYTPLLPQALLNADGFLSPVTSSLRQLGNMVVPTSSLIVGAKLYVAHMSSRRNVRDVVVGDGAAAEESEAGILFEDDEQQQRQYRFKTRNQFGRGLHVMIFTLRLILMPILGRIMYGILGVWKMDNKLLGMFSLMEWMVPTANSSVMAIILASQYWPGIGRQIEDDVASTLLYQTMAVPVLLTINTALALGVVF